MSRTRNVLLAAAAIFSSACETAPAPGAPAVLSDASAENLAALAAALGETLGRARVTLGPGDFTQSPVVSVLPPAPTPPEDRSLAAPAVFDLRIENGVCVAVSRADGAAAALPGVSCRPL